MHFERLHSTLKSASLAKDKQFNNFVTRTNDSLSTIGFHSIQDLKDSNNSKQRDTKQQPEIMAANYDLTAYATPGRHVEDDVVSMASEASAASVASVASTIFDGVKDERIEVLRQAAKIVSSACKRFVKQYDKAIAASDDDDDDDVYEVSLADDYRLEAVKKAWLFVDEI